MSLVRLRKDEEEAKHPLIMLFAEGTILKPKSLFSHFNHKAYIPIGNCVRLINYWYKQGAEIVYCTSLKKNKVNEMAELLIKHGFMGSSLYYRGKKQKYKDLVRECKPDILIEDDCRSIGGAWQMCITYTDSPLKENIKSIVIPEFKGIDHLPAEIMKLRDYKK